MSQETRQLPRLKGLSAVDLPRVIHPKYVAELLEVSPATVSRLIDKNEIPAYKIGGSYRIDPEDFVDFINGCSINFIKNNS